MVLQQMVQQQVVQPKVILSAPAAKTVKSVDLLKNPAAWVAAFGAGTPIDSGELVNRYIDTPWLNQGIEKRAKALANMPYAFLDKSGNQITDHTDFDSDKLGLKFNFSHLLDEHEGDLLLYGAAYAIVEMNEFGMNKQLRRLHPATITPIYSDIGELTHFERRVNGRGYNIPKEAMVYVWNTNRRHENGPGIPSAMSALLAAGLLHSIDEHGTNFFENGAVNPTLIQIEGYEQLAEPDKAAVRKWFTRMFGRGNGSGERVIPMGKNVEVKQAGDSMDKLAVPELTDKKREDISTALGVPQSLLFSNATNFATAEADRLSFYDFTVVPRAKQLQNAYNEQLFKALGIELKFKPDELEIYQQQEGKKSDRLAIMYDRGVIDVNEFREMMNMDPYSDEYIDRLRQAQNRLSNANSGQTDVQTGQDQIDLSGKTTSIKRVDSPRLAYASIPLANNKRIVQIVQSLKERLDDERIEWQAAPTYHVTLCHATDVTDRAITAMSQSLRMTEFDLIGQSLGVFDTPDGFALHIRLEKTEDLRAFQNHVWGLFEDEADGLSEFSLPDDYKPHITLAYLPKDIYWQQESVNFAATADKVIITRDDYEPALIVNAMQQFKGLLQDELRAWERKAKKRFKEGSPQKALDFDAEHIPATLVESIKGQIEGLNDDAHLSLIFNDARQYAALLH